MSNSVKSEILSDFLLSSDKLSKMLRSIGETGVEDMTDDEKLQAAYALNMCTVSVSQIIDYKDINILEQEYEAILNNLNLEIMPKDDALLHILRQILDTITYFRIEEGDKEMIEKEYQQKMKNAIWSAVPNFGLIVAGGNPLTMAISLASQVGIGYMNYRRNKAEYSLEREKQLWQLQRTAIEQFNGLRRELFDTAWRLADTYGFPDAYRLTEKQIKQYNKILTDPDELRKYERLESIKDKFEAYPPFWYFIGNAANYIAGNSDFNLSDKTRLEYRNKAKTYFEKYEELNRVNILREDQLVASCALEHIDLLLLDEKRDNDKIAELLDTAVAMSGNAFDILQMCALTYLKLDKCEEAARILRVLVNEDYNKIINAQLLSSIYVRTQNRSDYELLSTRVDPDYLYPMPEEGEDIELLENEFGGRQKRALKKKYRIVLSNFLQKYTVEWNRITSLFEMGVDYPEEFFYDNPKSRSDRKTHALRVFSDRGKKELYQNRIANANYELNILSILNEMFSGLFEFKSFENIDLQSRVEAGVKQKIAENKDDINDLQGAMLDGGWVLEGYLVSQKITLASIVGDALNNLLSYAYDQIDNANINDISYMESDLLSFCIKHELPEPTVIIGGNDKVVFDKDKELFKPELFGHQAVLAKKNADFLNDMISFMKEKMDAITVSSDEALVYFGGDPEFNGYFYNVTFENHPDIKAHATMIIKDKSKMKVDLVFTTDGIVDVVKDKVRNLTSYDEVKLKGDSLLLFSNFGKREFKNASININALYNLIRELGSHFIVGIEDKIEVVDEVVTAKLMNEWFKNNSEAMADDVTRLYAFPKKDILDHLGFHISDELDPDKHLIQMFYDSKTRDVLGMRIVRFDEIESNFQAKILENDGVLMVTK